MNRQDAAQGVIFREQLTLIEQKPFEKKYPAKKGRMILPLDSQGGPGTQKRKWRMMDRYGIAAALSDKGHKLPLVELSGEEFEATAKPYGIGAPFDWFEVEASKKSGQPLDSMKLVAARDGYEDLVDDLIFSGDPARKIQGLNDHPNIPIYTPGTSASGGDDTWPNKTQDEIIADVRSVLSGIRTTTKETQAANLVLLPTSRFDLIATMRVGDGGADRTVLQYLQSVFPSVKFDSWYRLETAGASSTKRMMALEVSEDVLYFWEPQPFTQYPDHKDGPFSWVVPYKGECGGVIVRRPLACAFMDGV
jgi:hypothetical protein